MTALLDVFDDLGPLLVAGIGGLAVSFSATVLSIALSNFVPIEVRATIFWCRRFGKSKSETGERNIWVTALISRAAQGLALPVTLRDRSVGVAPSNARIESVIGLAAGLLLIGGFFGGLALAWHMGMRKIPDSVIWVGFAVSFIVALTLAHLLTKWLGRRGTDFENALVRLADAKARGRADRDVFVAQGTDETWQEIVARLMRDCELIVIDATESSDAVSWETRRAIQTHEPANILIFRSEDTGRPAAMEERANRLPANLAHEKGLSWFDFGLSNADQQGLIRFKRKFATAEKDIVTLRHEPIGHRPIVPDGATRSISELTALLADERIPDDILDAASELLYRNFA